MIYDQETDDTGLPIETTDLESDPEAASLYPEIPTPSDSIAPLAHAPTPNLQAELNQFDPKLWLTEKKLEGQKALQEQYGQGNDPHIAKVEAGLRGATLGLSDAVLPAMGITTPEALRGRQQANPASALGGDIVGGGLLYGATGGFWGLAGKVAKKAGNGFAGKVIGEGAVNSAFTAGHVISELALGDPELNAEKIASELGMGFVIGSAFGAGVGALSKAIKAVPAVSRKAMDKVREFRFGNHEPIPTAYDNVAPKEGALDGAAVANQVLDEAGLKTVPITPVEELAALNPVEGAGPFREKLPLEALSKEDQKAVVDGLSEIKPNAAEIIEAGKTLGTGTPEGMLTKNKHVQKIIHALTKSPSKAGVDTLMEYEASYAKAADTISKTLGESTDLSLAQTGDKAKQIVVQGILDRYQPIHDLYKEIEEITPHVGISKQSSTGFKNSVMGLIHEHRLIQGTEPYNFIHTIAEGLGQVTDLKYLANFRTAMQDVIRHEPKLQFVGSLINEKLDSMELNAIRRYAGKHIPDLKLKKQIFGLSYQIEQASGKYREFRKNIEEIGKLVWGKGRISGVKDFIEKMKQETSENVAKKLFATNNSRALQWMNQEFPEAIALLSDFEKFKIRTKATHSNVFNPRSALKTIFNYKEVSPELRKLLFTPSQLEVFEAGHLWLNEMLPEFNPSGTAGALNYIEFLKHPIASATNYVKDLGIKTYIEHKIDLPPELAKAAGIEAEKIAGLKKLSDYVDKSTQKVMADSRAVFTGRVLKGGLYSAVNHKMSQKEYDEVSERVQEYSMQPQLLMDDLSEHTSGLFHSAPGITHAIINNAIKSVAFLNSKLPVQKSKMTFSPEWKPTYNEVAKFSHYFNIVNNPYLALAELKEGNLTMETMEVLQTVYPKLLEEMRLSILGNLDLKDARKIFYGQRLSLAMFLGQPLDESMTPQAIQSNQISFNQPRLSQQSTPQSGRKTGVGGYKQLNLASRLGTAGRREPNQD